MQTQDALKLLIEAVNLAQSRGAYNLKEASTILQAVETFTNNQDNNMNEETNTPTANESVVEQAITSPELVEGSTEQALTNDEVVAEVAPEVTPEA